jgi:hypothetical protein
MARPNPDRPHTLAGLIEKRAHLAGMLKFHHGEIRNVTCDLDHIDAAIRLFGPNADISRVIHDPTKHRARKGEASDFVMRALRLAKEPLTSIDQVKGQIKARGLKADDKTVVLMRKRVGATLTAMKNKGWVRSIPSDGPYNGWELIR